MSKRRVLLGLLLVVLTVDVRATIDNDPLWRQVSSIDLKADLVEANIGGRAALCSWVEKNKTTVLVGVKSKHPVDIKNKNKIYSIKKLVYSLGNQEPIITDTDISLEFIPRTILRTSSGILYLTANTAINSAWRDHFDIKDVKSTSFEQQRIRLASPESLNGGVWVSIDNGDKWVELTDISGKGIMNAGYIASYKPIGTNGTVDETAVRVGGAGISSREIICFKNENSANEHDNNKKSGSSRIQKLDDTHYFVISTVFDKIQGKASDDPIITRIGELPIDYYGMDSGKSAIRFSYVIDSYGCHGGGRDHAKVAKLGFETPIFDTPCSATDTIKTEDRQLGTDCRVKIKGSDSPKYLYHYGNTNGCFPDGYWRIIHRNHKGELDPFVSDQGKGYKNDYDSDNDSKNPTKDKYRNCVVSYDNSGLFLTKIHLSKEKQNTENTVEAYLGAIGDAKAPGKYFSNPQEVVAQYNGFMAIADSQQQIYIKSSRTDDDFHVTNFDTGALGRVMIAGVQPLDWHSTEDEIARYNGRLIAFGQLRNKFLVKLYMRATTAEISYTTVGDKEALDYKITGEPYAKVKLWWQKANEEDIFTELTYEKINANDVSIVDSSEIIIGKDGIFNSTEPYLPKAIGNYRLIASAVVGGFYCDYDQQLKRMSSVSNSESINVVPQVVPSISMASITQTQFWYDNESDARDIIKAIPVISGEEFLIRVNWIANFPKEGSLIWEQDNVVLFTDPLGNPGKGQKTHNFTFKNDGPEFKQQTIAVKVVAGDKEDKKTFNITVEPKLGAPTITIANSKHDVIFKNGTHNICDSKVIDLKIAAKGEIVWQRSMPHLTMWDKQFTKDKTNTLQTLQLIAGPTLHDDPCFSDLNNSDKDQWIFGDWKADRLVNHEKDNSYDIKSALHGKTKLELLSQDFMLIDARRPYLYIAAAKNAEADTKLTLILKCYNNKRNHIGDISLPEATITNIWSSYGAIIDGKDTVINKQSRKYLWPKDAVFVKIAIKLPESNKDGAYLSAVRLMELSQETLEILADDDRLSTSDDPWALANLWDNEVGRYTLSHSIERNYKAELKSGHQNATSEEIAVKVWSKIFFTKYALSNAAGNDLEIDADPDKPIVVRISTDDEAKLYIVSTDSERTWERTTEPDNESTWKKENDQTGRYYNIETAYKDEEFFVRAKARVKDTNNACQDQIKYSRIFKIVITKAKEEL
jgi:hypothetical protein